jgi:MerR family transcriptional regulator/heat shock protein HspR
MISAVAQTYNIHPQTLRLYEREGLLKPSRTEGNTRLYTEDDIQRLELILSLTRDLGVNLAGVEVVLNMREKMERMQLQMREFVSLVQREFMNGPAPGDVKNALVRFVPRSSAPVRVGKKRS